MDRGDDVTGGKAATMSPAMWIGTIVGIAAVSFVTYLVIIGIGMLEDKEPSDARMIPAKQADRPAETGDAGPRSDDGAP